MSCTIEVQPLILGDDKVSRNLRRVALFIPIIAFLAGTLAMVRGARFGFLAIAVILGWTQLVGL